MNDAVAEDQSLLGKMMLVAKDIAAHEGVDKDGFRFCPEYQQPWRTVSAPYTPSFTGRPSNAVASRLMVNRKERKRRT